MDMVCFHSQQVVEKSLKALLTLHQVEYPWRHDLAELVELAKTFNSNIMDHEERLISLTSYAVEARYDVEFAPSSDKAKMALDTAIDFYKFVNTIFDAIL